MFQAIRSSNDVYIQSKQTCEAWLSARLYAVNVNFHDVNSPTAKRQLTQYWTPIQSHTKCSIRRQTEQWPPPNERTLLFIDAIHIDDDHRLLISSHKFVLCFTDSVSWLEFLSCARLVNETGDGVPFSQHFKVSQLNSPNQHATHLVHESGLPLFQAL